MSSREFTAEEAKRVCDEFNAKVAPVENAFMAYVYAYRTVGYGRMMQMIQEHWDAELKESRRVFDGNSSRDVP